MGLLTVIMLLIHMFIFNETRYFCFFSIICQYCFLFHIYLRDRKFTIFLFIFIFLHILHCTVIMTVQCHRCFKFSDTLCHIFFLILEFSLFFLYKRLERLFHHNFQKFLFMRIPLTDVP